MKSILQKIPKPIPLLILFILFVSSIIILINFMDYMYSHKILNILIVIVYFIPGLLFFSIASGYNFLINKNYNNLFIKIITLIPLIVILIYFLYFLIVLLLI